MTAAAHARVVVDDLVVRTSAGETIVSGVAFTIGAGQVFGLVGESGSGKTTVAHALLAHARRGLRIVDGHVRIDGQDVLALEPGPLRALRGRMIAFVPQDPASALNPALRVGTQLREVFPRSIAADDVRARIVEVLREVHLSDPDVILRRFPHQLSGGQQQRVALAMAFAARPAVIVLDEPTTGLDVTTQRRVLQTVQELCASYSAGALYVTHDLAVVAEISDAVAVMYAGRVVEMGPTRSVFASPDHPYTVGLLAAAPSTEKETSLVGIEGLPPSLARPLAGCSFAPRCAFALAECRAADPPLEKRSPDRAVRCIRPGIARATGTQPLAQRAHRSGSPILDVDGVRAWYPGRPAPVLRDVTFAVPAAGCLAIVGESGSGKSTLARSIVGLHRNWVGRIAFAGLPLPPGLADRALEASRHVQYVFQNPYTSLNPRRTVGQIIEQPLMRFERLSAAARLRRVLRTMSEVALDDDLLGRYPDQLSGGQRQRVAIARALIVEPKLLLCDEVTSALDVSVQAVIVELLRNLQRDRDLTLLFITHNLALAKSIAQDVVVLSNGEIVETGSAATVFSSPTHPYTKQLVQDIPRFDTTLAEQPARS